MLCSEGVGFSAAHILLCAYLEKEREGTEMELGMVTAQQGFLVRLPHLLVGV